MSYQDRDYYRPGGFGGFSFMPPVIKNLLIINVAMFFLSVLGEAIMVGNLSLSRWITIYLGLIPFNAPYASFLPWQLVTYQFLHGGLGHIFFNMLMLWMFGMELENLWGSKKFLSFYLISGIGAGLFQLFLAPLFSGGLGPTIGASGAVYGIMLAFAFYFPDRYIYIYFLFPVKAKYLVVGLMVIEFLSVGNQSFTAHLAHIGGALFGLGLILLDKYSSLRVEKIFDYFSGWGKSSGSKKEQPKFRRPVSYGSSKQEVQEATFYDINKNEPKQDVTPEDIDRILDKISRSGYQNLTEEEKRILFEASKKD
ncbi:MAG: rhomboid family intramembrane serine protease [Melioribacteraceae bacterium]|nr:MAG: rhomboid family intramembrane serine protease [Melioribacteraceae bacterium]